MEGPNNLWINRPIVNSQASFRLFCFPYAGGGTSIYYKWPDNLPNFVELCSIRLPGRENRLTEPTFTRLIPLIDELANVIYPYLNIPFAFFGHSLGALICFELARQLRRQRINIPDHLFISGCRAPQLPKSTLILSELKDQDLLGELRKLDGTPSELLHNNEFLQIMLPTLRADFSINETYKYNAEVPLGCSISVLGGLQDSDVSSSDLLAWQDQTSNNFQLHMFPGNHFFINSALKEVIQIVNSKIIELNQLRLRRNTL